MIRILDIAEKDLIQLLRDRKTFLFFLIMPIAFTILFGYAFSGGGGSDPRIPVAFIRQEQTRLSEQYTTLLAQSGVIRVELLNDRNLKYIESRIANEEFAAAIILPEGYTSDLVHGKPAKLTLIADTSTPVGTSIQSEVLTTAIHLESAVRTAVILDDLAGEQISYEFIVDQVIKAWQDPPISISDSTSTAINKVSDNQLSIAHSAPGMMLQFAIAGLLVCAQVLVTERKTRSLQRLLTTATARMHILLGHYLAIFSLIFSQFLVLLTLGQFVLGLNYLRVPFAVLLVAIAAASCIAALGLLIGVFAKSEEQAIIFSLIPMFLLAGLGGAWVPLEVTGASFQAIGHISPVAWAMDGFKNIITRGLGFESVILPTLALISYAAIFLILATWRFNNLQET
jgi:ABC-2 type transport system permease protein